jgi:hypothetical protein
MEQDEGQEKTKKEKGKKVKKGSAKAGKKAKATKPEKKSSAFEPKAPAPAGAKPAALLSASRPASLLRMEGLLDAPEAPIDLEGWDGGQGGPAFDEIPADDTGLTEAAATAQIARSGARGYVAVQENIAAISKVKEIFARLVSEEGTTVDRVKVVEELRQSPQMETLASVPVRIREHAGPEDRAETFEQVGGRVGLRMWVLFFKSPNRVSSFKVSLRAAGQ